MRSRVDWSQRVFRILLHAYPRRIRDERGEDMWQTFVSHLHDARGIGRLSVFNVWRREILALWLGGRRARVFEKEKRRSDANRTASTPPSPINWLGSSTLDFKLGFRMLVRHPGLTVVGVFAMSIGIAIGAGSFEFFKDVFDPKLPFEDGDRIVGLWNWDVAAQSAERRSLHDFVTWRNELSTVEDVGAATSIGSNLITQDGYAEPVVGVAISASAFRLTRIPPLVGRPIVEADEREGSPSVVVIGYNLWQSRFGGEPSVLGQTVQLGQTNRTVVGVMPEGFAFPYYHELWVPLQANVLEHERRTGPVLEYMFGRLAPGVTLADARAELTAIGERTAISFPESNEHLQPHVASYAISLLYSDDGPGIKWFILGLQSMWLMVLLVACVNVATLVFARTAARESEIVVRNALGASRGRIVRQLFVEALVLAAIAGVIALVVIDWGTRWAMDMVRGGQGGHMPFFWNENLSLTAFIFTGALVLFAAAVTGVMPALKVTGSRTQNRLQRTSAKGLGLRFGALSTGLIVIQVAGSVALLTSAFGIGQHFLRVQTTQLPFPADEYLAARLQMDRIEDEDDFASRYARVYTEIARRVVSETGVTALTFADRLPAMSHPCRRIEMDGGAREPNSERQRVCVARVAPDFFETLTVPIVSGRDFRTGNAESTRNVVIVNESFVGQIFGGQTPIGRRVRYATRSDVEAGPWYEIVGVVANVAMKTGEVEMNPPGLYHPIEPTAVYPGAAGESRMFMVARVAGAPTAFASQLRKIAATVDPTLKIDRITTVADILKREQAFSRFMIAGSSLIAAMVLLLAAAGTYALMSFTVSQRTREIGIRTALGADPQRILRSIFRRALVQLGLGVIIGAAFGIFVASQFSTSINTFLPICAIMMTVGVLACAVPARRALRIQPTDALRENG